MYTVVAVKSKNIYYSYIIPASLYHINRDSSIVYDEILLFFQPVKQKMSEKSRICAISSLILIIFDVIIKNVIRGLNLYNRLNKYKRFTNQLAKRGEIWYNDLKFKLILSSAWYK